MALFRSVATVGSLTSLPDSTGACRYVASQIRPGDKTMVTEPHPHAAFLEIGHADYDLSVPVPGAVTLEWLGFPEDDWRGISEARGVTLETLLRLSTKARTPCDEGL